MTPGELATSNTAMVHKLAHVMRGLLGGELDELIGDGMVGLVQAAQRFDPACFDGPFATYAKSRVKGAMVDGFRRRHRTGHNHSSGPRVELLALDCWVTPTVAPSHYPWMVDRRNGRVRAGDLIAAADSAEQQVLDSLALADLLERVAELPETLQAPVRVVMEGGTFKGLAEREGVTQSRISQRLAEARRRLAA